MSDYVETTRWIRLIPKYNRDGTVKALEIGAMTKSQPKEMVGPLVKLTFRVPCRVFSPVADLIVELDDEDVAGSPVVLARSLRALREQLELGE